MSEGQAPTIIKLTVSNSQKEAPFKLEGFRAVRRLGGGGFGDVWLAVQTNVDRKVALKVGHSPIEDESVKVRFDRECKALGRLSGHPNILDVFTAGSLDDGRPYLVLEYVDGGTLWQLLKAGPIPENQLARIGLELAKALDIAHRSGILHRDIKPENILLRKTGAAVLGDFGIARIQDGTNTTSASITASVAYAAPEILSGTKATVSSDLYGIGVCLLAASLRAVPFVQKADESIHPVINRVLSEKPPNITTFGMSPQLAEIVESLLSKDPAKRPVSAAVVVEHFEKLLDSRTGHAQTRPANYPKPAAQTTQMGASGQQGQVGGSVLGNQPAPSLAGSGSNGNLVTATPQRATQKPASALRLFMTAYLATAVIAGAAIYLISRLL